jgi:thiol:disulfide interchange protein
MTRYVCTALVLAALLGAGAQAAPSAPQAAQTTGARGSAASGEKAFNPRADPVKDLADAVAQARATHRRIILDVGGEWCSWCHILDRFIREHQDVSDAIAHDYVWLKINFSPDNQNAAFLKNYPKIPGYPHLFVLSTDGQLLHSQDTSLLEEGPSYNLAKVREFLAKWKN